MLAYFKKKWAQGPKLRSVAACSGGMAAVEMAFILPLFIGLTAGGVEVTYYSNTRMKLAQLALHAADHASRMGTSTVLQNLPVNDGDVNDVMAGTLLQGDSIDLRNKGRVIISSLQQNSSGGQWIAWQRCDGNPLYDSTHGIEGNGKTGTSFPGMGYNGKKITARAGEAVMFAEIRYKYEPIFDIFETTDEEYIISEIATFNVRDDRDISRLYRTSGAPVKTC